MAKTSLIGFLVIIIIIVIGLHIMASFMHYDDDEIQSIEGFQYTTLEIRYIPWKDDSLRIIKTSVGPQKKVILGIHGAPGGWDTFKEYHQDKRILKEADFISYDRPGYGNSTHKAYPFLHDQVDALLEVVSDLEGYKDIYLMSHSYGGPIGAKISMDSSTIKGHLMLSPAISPSDEKYFWFSPFGKWKATRWLLPYALRNSGIEKYAHEAELQKLSLHLRNVTVKTLFIHGKNDGIAPDGNIGYVQSMIPKENLDTKIWDAGHLFIWRKKEKVVNELLQFIKSN